MPYAPHIRMTASGHFGGASANYEQFSFSLALEGSSLGGFDSDGALQLMADTRMDVATFFNGPIRFPANAVLDEVKFASIGPDGAYTDDAVIIPAVTPGSGSDAPQFPSQVALAISLQTERRGASGRGRFYVPAPQVAIMSTTGTMAVPDQERCVGAAEGLLNAINNAPNLDINGPRFQVVVASSKGFNSPVTRVRVGKALDTIRSRRRSLEEAYLSVPLAPVSPGG